MCEAGGYGGEERVVCKRQTSFEVQGSEVAVGKWWRFHV